ncbi:MAG: CBS domain-containing protein [Nitrospirae bacterium]|nr:CBS domain-containing protein [Nitrospirota bacterium]
MMIPAKYLMIAHKRVALGSNSNGKEVIYRLMAAGLPGLPVVNEEMEVIGIVTTFDLLGVIREGLNLAEITAAKIMSKAPVTADPETTSDKLIEMMLENNFTVIPIVKDKRLVGVVDRFSIMDAHIEPRVYPGVNRYFEG